MTEKVLVEIFIAMDEDGDYTVGVDRDQAIEMFEEAVGGGGPRRIVRLTAMMRPPSVETGPEVDIPDDAGETVLAATGAS